MHKNTLLLTAFLAVIAALLVGINIGRSLPAAQSPSPSPTPLTTPTPTLAMLAGETCGISYLYPNTLRPFESSDSGVVLTHTTKPEESIVIACQEDIPRVPLTDDNIEPMVIRAATGSASASANLYHDTSAKDGAQVDKLIFTHPKTKLDVFIAGFGITFNQLITTIKLR